MAIEKNEKQWLFLLIPVMLGVGVFFIAYGLFYASFSKLNSEFAPKNTNITSKR